jgi:hypothetical protein
VLKMVSRREPERRGERSSPQWFGAGSGECMLAFI